ncbi:MAG: TIGR01906 family membrane protein [Anaerolineae bacterium]|nr:TIGR01906 family membrane protein [Anaerolineae bacterium]
MKANDKLINAGIKWLAAITIPLFLVLTVTRILATPLWVKIEYRMPGFPEDGFGLTLEDRAELAPLALAYLFNDAGIEFLGDQSFPDGSPIYSDRELRHMQDVKVFTQAGLKIWFASIALLLGLAAFARQTGRESSFRAGAAQGGKLTVWLLAFLLALIALNFEQVFITFHAMFFEGDTWLFLFSDTLIRLFPMRFWQDAFTFVGGVTFACGLFFWYRFSKDR